MSFLHPEVADDSCRRGYRAAGAPAHLPDPEKILQGSGSRIRSLRLEPFSLLRSEIVEELLAQSIHPLAAELAVAPRLTTIIKSESARQRPRRPSQKSTQPTVRRKGRVV